MSKENPPGDEFEAMRTVVAALEHFKADERQRILRYVQEKLGITAAPSVQHIQRQGGTSDSGSNPPPPPTPGTVPNIRTFIENKGPRADVQFAAAVAYFYRFEAAPEESITADDLQEACRQVGRERFPRPAQTLINAHKQGLLDKGTDRGAYTLSTVGENLVAVALPADGSAPRSRKAKKKSSAKKKSKKGR
jgi:hypothetical protein